MANAQAEMAQGCLAQAATQIEYRMSNGAPKCIACGRNLAGQQRVYHDNGANIETWCIDHWNRYNLTVEHVGCWYVPNTDRDEPTSDEFHAAVRGVA